jgi:hypothetical protein
LDELIAHSSGRTGNEHELPALHVGRVERVDGGRAGESERGSHREVDTLGHFGDPDRNRNRHVLTERPVSEERLGDDAEHPISDDEDVHALAHASTVLAKSLPSTTGKRCSIMPFR